MTGRFPKPWALLPPTWNYPDSVPPNSDMTPLHVWNMTRHFFLSFSFQTSQLIFLQHARSFLHQVISWFLIWNLIFLILAYMSCSYSSRFNLKLTSSESMALGKSLISKTSWFAWSLHSTRSILYQVLFLKVSPNSFTALSTGRSCIQSFCVPPWPEGCQSSVCWYG